MLASLVLATAPALAQNEYIWVAASNVTGEVVTAWASNDSSDVKTAFYSLGAWSAVESVPNSASSYADPICASMDTLGNSILVWGDDSGTIWSSVKLAGQDWSNAAMISLAADYSVEPILTIDPAGNATAIWLDYELGLQSSNLPVGTTTWSAPVTISG